MPWYLSDLSQRIVTIVLFGPNSSASFIAPATLIPELVPKLRPSFSIRSNKTVSAVVSFIE